MLRRMEIVMLTMIFAGVFTDLVILMATFIVKQAMHAMLLHFLVIIGTLQITFFYFHIYFVSSIDIKSFGLANSAFMQIRSTLVTLKVVRPRSNFSFFQGALFIDRQLWFVVLGGFRICFLLLFRAFASFPYCLVNIGLFRRRDRLFCLSCWFFRVLFTAVLEWLLLLRFWLLRVLSFWVFELAIIVCCTHMMLHQLNIIFTLLFVCFIHLRWLRSIVVWLTVLKLPFSSFIEFFLMPLFQFFFVFPILVFSVGLEVGLRLLRVTTKSKHSMFCHFSLMFFKAPLVIGHLPGIGTRG